MLVLAVTGDIRGNAKVLSAMVFNIYNKLPTVVRYWLGILASAIQNWLASQAFIYAAALAFFTVFSIAPILVVVVGLVGLVMGESAVQGELFAQLEATLGPDAAGVVQTAVLMAQAQRRVSPTLKVSPPTVLTFMLQINTIVKSARSK